MFVKFFLEEVCFRNHICVLLMNICAYGLRVQGMIVLQIQGDILRLKVKEVK